ncbi:hypothetical protein BUALT_Bualt06G0056700 [Buddleja alternifolia]|uniref:Uncharacterized protein n=1 Tax=Buddleja alternifolia TaxID=168488 RepID=A0AAV6XHH3_9LAMI|nr:hypothetical protein BUALT_Bualt06G0056700 [Buddleja alternifolia]
MSKRGSVASVAQFLKNLKNARDLEENLVCKILSEREVEIGVSKDTSKDKMEIQVLVGSTVVEVGSYLLNVASNVKAGTFEDALTNAKERHLGNFEIEETKLRKDIRNLFDLLNSELKLLNSSNLSHGGKVGQAGEVEGSNVGENGGEVEGSNVGENGGEVEGSSVSDYDSEIETTLEDVVELGEGSGVGVDPDFQFVGQGEENEGDVGGNEGNVRRTEGDVRGIEGDVSEEEGEECRHGIELGDPENINQNENESSSESNFFGEDDVVGSDSDFNEDRVSTDDDEGPNYQAFNPKHIFAPEFCIGLLFSTKKEFKKAIQSHGVNTKRNIFKSDEYRGMAFKNALWNVACATTVNDFKVVMAEMKTLDQSAFD